MESSNTDGGLSLNSSGHSTFALAEKENQIEQLRRKLRVLESDNAELLSTLPRLKDAQGKDCTGEMIKANKELLMAKEQCERWRNDYMEMTMKYDKFEKMTIAQLDQRDKQITQLRHQAMEMEEENAKLREVIENEKSRIWHLQRGEFDQHLATPKAVRTEEADDQLATPKANNQILTTSSSQPKGVKCVDVVEESYLCNVEDADQIAAYLLMILETLDKNTRDSAELQNDIFTFLASHGICSNNPEKVAVLNAVYKKVTDKGLTQIRVGNEQFCSNISVGDKDMVDACMKHLAVHDTLSSVPSFAGFSKEIALQLETSTPETDNDHNLTSGSVLAANVTCRTSTLLEVCVRMFEKLRGTAEFFQNLLKMIGVNAEDLGEDFAKKLEAMKLDLDISVGEAQSMLSEGGLAAIEESFAQSRFEREQQLNDLLAEIQTMRKDQQNVEENKQKLEQLLAEERDRVLKVIAERDAFERELRDRETDIEWLNNQMQELQKLKEEMDQANQALQSEIDKMTNSDLKEKVLVHSREELNKIFDTMQYTMSSCSSVVSSLGKKKVKIGKKSSTKENQK